MGRLAAGLIPILLLAAPAFAQPSALTDSLLTWRDAGRPDMVDSLAGPAIVAARESADSTDLLNLLLIRGATRASFGMARGAEGDLREGFDLAVASGDTLRRLQCLRWLSVAVGQQGRGAEATGLYRELEDLATMAADSVHLGWAWVGLAYGSYLGGDAEAAGAGYARAAGVLERHGEVRGARWAWNGRSLALRQEGRYREARVAFARMVRLVAGTGDPVNEALALDQLGRLDLMLGDPARAVALFQRSIGIHRKGGHRREGLVPSIDLAKARTMQGRYPEAVTLLDSVLVETRTHGLRDLEVLTSNSLADAWLAQGRPGAAADQCRALLGTGPMPSRLQDTETRLRLARALADRDSLNAAAGVLRAVDDPGAVSLEMRTAALLGAVLVDSGQPDAAAMVLRTAVATAAAAGGQAELVVLLTHLGRAESARARPDSALAAFDRAAACWEKVRAWPTDPVWREHRGTVAGSLFACAAAEQAKVPGGLAAAWDLIQRYKARTLRERMLGPDAEDAAAATPGLADFRRGVLRPGEVLLDLVEGERVSVLICATSDTAFAARLPGRRTVEPRLRRLTDVVRSPAVDDPEPVLRMAQEIVKDLPAEVQRLAAGAHTVWWCPDGSRHRLPTALLSWSAHICRIPGAGVLAHLRDGGAAVSDPPSILAVAGPDPDTGEPLPGARQEIDWLSSHLTEVQVPVATQVESWRGADVLHVAAHTILDEHQPWQSAITLGVSHGEVRATDVAGCDLDARLAVLAGCTTAGERVVGGEGLIGLAGAFMAAGTPTVVATLWPVDDAVAFRMTTGFYGGLADGLTAAAALDRARAACRRDPETSAPRHWAAFVLVGDGDVTVPVRRRAARWPWILVLAVLAVAAGLRTRR